MKKTTPKLISIVKQTSNKYLNLYQAIFENGTQKVFYDIASRKKTIESMYLSTHKLFPDGVRIIPYFYDQDGMKVVLIKEFRYPINDYVYGVPAGCVDGNEDPMEACKRELMEEIGAKVIHITQTEKPSFSLAGLTDEINSSFEAEVELIEEQHLESNENIEVVVVPFENLSTFLDTHPVALLSLLQLRAFYYKNKK